MLLARMPAPLKVARNGSRWEIMKKYLPTRDGAAHQVTQAFSRELGRYSLAELVSGSSRSTSFPCGSR